MPNPLDPPVDTSIFEYPPSFPNGQVNDAWVAYFQSINSAFTGGPVLSFNGRGGAVVPISGDYSAGQIAGLAAFIAANGVSSFNGRIGDVLPTLGDYPASLIPFTQAGTGAVPQTVDAKLKQSVSVLDFGADATGVSDSTAAFNNALAVGKAVYVPSGTYLLSSLAVITGSFDLHGDGKSSVLNFNTAGVGVQLTHAQEQKIKGSIRNLAFSQITNVPAAFIRNTGYLNLLISECFFNNTSATYCIDNYLGYGLTINKCVFSDITGSAIRLRDDGAVNYYSYVAKIRDCDITAVSGDGIDVEGAHCLDIVGCAIESCGGYGILTNSNGGSGGIQSWGINIECCDFEVNTLDDIKLGTDGSSYWGVATLKNCTFSGAPSINLGAKSKVFIESTYCFGGSPCTITGSSVAEAILVNSTGFTQSGSFSFTQLSGGVLSLPNGAVGSPSLNLGDTATGFYRLSSNKIGFTANGVNIGDFGSAGWDFNGGAANFNAGVNANWVNGSSTGTIRLAGGGFALFQMGPTVAAITNTQIGNGALNNSLGAFIDTTSAGVINFRTGTTAILGGSFAATGKFTFFVPVAATASANFPVGATVTSPAAGDLWNDATGTLNFKGNFGATGYTAQAIGGSVASAAAITPTGPVFHITGTTTVTTINLPYTGFTGTIHIIPDAATPFGSAGNIATATVCTVGKTMSFTYDGTKWYPSY